MMEANRKDHWRNDDEFDHGEDLPLVDTTKKHPRNNQRSRRRSFYGLLLLILLALGTVIKVSLVSTRKDAQEDLRNKKKPPQEEPIESVPTTPPKVANVIVDKRSPLRNTSMEELEQALGSTFVRFEISDNELLSVEKLKEQFIALLRERGLIILGDSTTRVLYGMIMCLVEGYLDMADPNKDFRIDRCEGKQKELKEHCQGENVKTDCERTPVFTNYTDLYLHFIPFYFLSKPSELLADELTVAMEEKNRVVYIGMPCLHSLWSPGDREIYVHSKCTDWCDLHQQLWSVMGDILSTTSVTSLVGTTVALCNAKLGHGYDLIQSYRRNETFSAANESIWNFYNNGKDYLPSNYSGPIVPLKGFRRDGTCDWATLEEFGAEECSKFGLQALTRQTWAPRVLDMHGATNENGHCDDTSDGIHYSGGRTVRRQLMLLLKGSLQP